jgi:hypothetical protein
MLNRLKAGDLVEMKFSDASKSNQPGAWKAAGATMPGGTPDWFLRIPAQRYRLHHPKPVTSMWGTFDVSKVDTIGTHHDRLREFVWLPYIPGHVAYTAIQPDLPILTGKMDGCWLVLFTMGGKAWFGHVGTEGNEYTSASMQAKNAWTIALGTRVITSLGAFDPVHASKPIRGDTTLGALAADQKFYVIDCHRGFPGPAGKEIFLPNTIHVNDVYSTVRLAKPIFK